MIKEAYFFFDIYIYIYIVESDLESDLDIQEISSDEDEDIALYMNNARDRNNNKSAQIFQTKYKYIDDILYYHKNNSSSRVPNYSLLTSSWLRSKEVRFDVSKHFVCFGTRDGFFFKIGCRCNGSEQYEDFKFMIPWHNVAKVGTFSSSGGDIFIGIKFCVPLKVQRLTYREIDAQGRLLQGNDEDDISDTMINCDDMLEHYGLSDSNSNNNNNKNRRKKKNKKKKKRNNNDDEKDQPLFKRSWVTIPPSSYPESVKKFCKYPKIMFKLPSYQYSITKVRLCITNHMKIMNFQRLRDPKFMNFNNKIDWNYNDREKKDCEMVYKGHYAPYLDDHDKLIKNIDTCLRYMFSAQKGRYCVVCGKNIGYFEEHPVCIRNEHTMDSCDSNIIKSIYTTKYDDPEVSLRNKICLVYYSYE